MTPPITEFEPGTTIGSLRILYPELNDKGQRSQMCECLLCGERVVRSNSYIKQAGIVQGYNISCGCSRKAKTPRRVWRDMFLWLTLKMIKDKVGHVQTDRYDPESPIWMDEACDSNLEDAFLYLRDVIDDDYEKSYEKSMALRMLQTTKFWLNQL